MNIGIDIGGTNIGAGLLNENLEIIHRVEIPTNAQKGYDYVVSQIISIIEELQSEAKRLGKKVDSIGIGLPGIVDVSGDYVIYNSNLKWRNAPLGKNLRKRFDMPIHVENDATVAGIAESVLGVSKGYTNSVFITIGTGVGGGIIINDKVYSGSHGLGSEIGHMIVGENFYNCNCGNNGCLETFTSSTALQKYVVHEIKNGFTSTSLLKKVENIDDITTKLIFECAEAGDELSTKVVHRMVKYLAIGIANIINILDPDVIVIGGGVAKAGDFLLDKIKGTLPQYILFKGVDHGEIQLAKLGNDAGIIGAAMLHRYK